MKVIKLADGSALEININFLTLKLIMSMEIFEEVEKEKKKGKEISPFKTIDLIGKMIYAIMYSNGKKLTEDDALALVPLGDDEAFFILFEEFQEKIEEFQKKTQSRMNLEKIAK